MRMRHFQAVAALAVALAAVGTAQAQLRTGRPVIGYVYPAGGQAGSTVEVRLGGRAGLANVIEARDAVQVHVTGPGVQSKVVDYFGSAFRAVDWLGDQLSELVLAQDPSLANRRLTFDFGNRSIRRALMLFDELKKAHPRKSPVPMDDLEAPWTMMTRIEKRLREFEMWEHPFTRPKCLSHVDAVIARVTIAPDAEPGPREIRLITPRGVSNPMVFYVGQVPETHRRPMVTECEQDLGKEEGMLRRRPDDEVEVRVTLPCTVNGQIAYGEVNQYRFAAKKGQKLQFATSARELIPYIADAVPGWFQPVIALYDDKGKEVAYNDDFRGKPDPVLFFTVPHDGEYLLTIRDAIFRGREDFVYRVTMGEMPYLTSIFPLGGKAGAVPAVEMKGWNLQNAKLIPLPKDARPGLHYVTAQQGKFVTNRMPFVLDTLPECREVEPNHDMAHAQKLTLPIIVNGRVQRPEGWDVFQFHGKAGQTIVAEVMARRLDSPLDSILKLTDATGKLIAVNDDNYDLGSGLNTHHADSSIMVSLPAEGTYYLWLGDTQGHGGEEYAYRLRVSSPRPDFALRAVPSGIELRGRAPSAVSVYAIRTDGMTGPITLRLKNPPEGISAAPVTIAEKQPMAVLQIRTTRSAEKKPIRLVIEGVAKIGTQEITHEAVPAEDRMQAFFWRHLVPAEEFVAQVQNPAYQVPRREDIREFAAELNASTKGFIRGYWQLYEDHFVTEDFYKKKVKAIIESGKRK